MKTANNDPHTRTHGKSRSTGIIIGAVIVLTLFAVWLVPGDKQEHADIPLPAAKSVPAAKPAPAPAVDQAPAQASPATDTPDTPAVTDAPEGQAAREFIAMAKNNGASMDTLFERAEEFGQSGKQADAHLLYFQAARQGHAGASMALAKQADPAFYSADTSVLDKPYITQARKWYLVAANAGESSAPELLENLHRYVQEQAAAGDPEANRLLLQWK